MLHGSINYCCVSGSDRAGAFVVEVVCVCRGVTLGCVKRCFVRRSSVVKGCVDVDVNATLVLTAGSDVTGCFPHSAVVGSGDREYCVDHRPFP